MTNAHVTRLRDNQVTTCRSRRCEKTCTRTRRVYCKEEPSESLKNGRQALVKMLLIEPVRPLQYHRHNWQSIAVVDHTGGISIGPPKKQKALDALADFLPKCILGHGKARLSITLTSFKAVELQGSGCSVESPNCMMQACGDLRMTLDKTPVGLHPQLFIIFRALGAFSCEPDLRTALGAIFHLDCTTNDGCGLPAVCHIEA